MTERRFFLLLTASVLAICAFYWASALSFFPVPWPDDSAFFLTGKDWIHWPSHYAMRSQAPFVPSYEFANFNTMPGLPLLLGIGNLLGIRSSHAIRLFGISAFGLWAVLLGFWLRQKGLPRKWIWALSLAAVLSPPIRWGAMVTRTEVWEGLIWFLILMEIDGTISVLKFLSKNWRLPLLLSLAAYFHFEAIVWLPPVVAVILVHFGVRKLMEVGLKSAVLLLPWFVYVLAHRDDFWIQMHTQFGRLDAHHPYITSAHSFFHSLFLDLGNPEGYPKFFNLGKMLFWLALVFSFLKSAIDVVRRKDPSGAGLAACLSVVTTFYLWCTKPETWFTTMIHMSTWPLIGFSIWGIWNSKKNRKLDLLLIPLILLLVLEAGTSVRQWQKTRGIYSWTRYNEWVNCIRSDLGTRTKIWQPHWPDILVELSGDSDQKFRQLFRAVDFQNIDPLIDRFVYDGADAIVHSLYLPSEADYADYDGQARTQDKYYLDQYPWLPFQKYSALRMGGGWDLKVCQRGPFWAAITLKKKAGPK